VVPAARTRYLAEISDTVRGYKQQARAQARLAREDPATQRNRPHAAGRRCHARRRQAKAGAAIWRTERTERQDPAAAKAGGPVARNAKAYAGDEYVVKIRDKEMRTALTTKSSAAPPSARSACPPTRTMAKS
jgi:methylmalonyl-CoA mutase